MAVQIAVARGVRVVGTASPRDHDLLRELGVVPVDVSVAVVTDRSRIVTIAAFDYGAQRGIVRIGGGPGADPGTEIRDAARLELVRLVEDGALRVFVAATYPLEKAADAHRALTAPRPPGTIILVV